MGCVDTLSTMYVDDEIGRKQAEARIAVFADQTRRFLSGCLTEDEFGRYRQQNGVAIARHAPVLRIAIPYGMPASLAAKWSDPLHAGGSVRRRCAG
jgi:sulfite reductase (NADPH) hemoprotein beta-component